jgi:hypothetical protein
VLRNKCQYCLGAITDCTPVKPGYGFVGFIKQEVDSPLNSVARHAEASDSEGPFLEIAALYAGLEGVTSFGV